jgi:hypothetical protein
MNLQQRARNLTQGAKETRNPMASQSTVEEGERREQSQEMMHKIASEHIDTLNGAIKEIFRGICAFSAVTDRVENEKREIYKLSEDVKNQKLEVGKLLFALDREIKLFPQMADKSIESSIGISSQNLHNAINGLVTEIRQAVLQIFKQQIEVINNAAAKTAKSADDLVNAKRTFGWESLCINLIAVLIASIALIFIITPRIPEYRVNAEEQRHIINGKNFEAIWPMLSQKTQQEIKAAYSRQ